MRIIRRCVTPLLCFLALGMVVSGTRAMHRGGSPHPDDAADPWSAAQTIQPADFVKELAGAHKPVVVCVGFRALYEGSHIPGASFHGAASTEQGLAGLKSWAQSLPKSSNAVLYCGCCPLSHCPNLRPAFAAMRDMGFSNLRVLILPNDFNTDWIEKGYPVEKGK